MGREMTGLALLYEDVPAWLRVFYAVSLVVVLALIVWATVLFVASVRGRRRAPAPVSGDDYVWVFLVPALDEEVTIRDSVERLLRVECEQRLVVVIDDGSRDATPEVLAAMGHPDLHVVRRDLPDARTGKAAALNDAYRRLPGLLAASRYAAVPRDRVVCVIVDADGRLDPVACRYVAARLADAGVGGVQALVRIYNRGAMLTWLQDVEFGIFGALFQGGRTLAGTASMGGNGQFNRLSALDSIVDERTGGPWSDVLTEDQDLGLRLVHRGWRGEQELRASVDQQGVSDLRRLLRQRTRWAQGNLQAMKHAGDAVRTARPLAVRVDLVASILMPVLIGLLAVQFVASLVLVVLGATGVRNPDAWDLVVLYVLAFGPVLIGCVARGSLYGARGILLGILIAQVFAFYIYLIWPIYLRAAIRYVLGRESWQKTSREPIADQRG